MTAKLRAFLRDFWTLAAPYWSSEERWRAGPRSSWSPEPGAGLPAGGAQHLEPRVLRRAAAVRLRRLHEALLCVHGARGDLHRGARSTASTCQQMLQIRWRRWLTDRYVGDWLGDRAYYRMRAADTGTDNPDQRIADDLRLFVDQSLDAVARSAAPRRDAGLVHRDPVGALGLVRVRAGGRSFAMPGYMVWAALVYAIVGTWLTHWIGKPLPRLNFTQQRYEADFRFSLVRVRESAEGIALYRGEADEARRLPNASATCAATGGRSCAAARSGCAHRRLRSGGGAVPVHRRRAALLREGDPARRAHADRERLRPRAGRAVVLRRRVHRASPTGRRPSTA